MQIKRRPISTLKKAAAMLIPVVTVTGLAFMAHTTYATSSVTVDQNDTHGWAFSSEGTAGGIAKLALGPDTPPSGSGSASLGLNVADQGSSLGTKEYAGTKLSDITNLSYNTYVQTGNNLQAPALQLAIDGDSTDSDTTSQGRLVYEPYYTHSVTDHTWQEWNALDNAKSNDGKGNWWFTDDKLSDDTGCTQAKPCTWEDVTKALPNASISSEDTASVLFKAGGGWTVPFLGNVDKATMGVKDALATYDFEYAKPSKVTGLSGLQNNAEIGCDAVVNDREITAKWNANTDASFDHFVYQSDADQIAPFDYTTNLTTNSRTAQIPDADGTYSYRVAAVDSNGVQSEWSDWCGVTLDREAPDVSITSPANGTTVSGKVKIQGTISDDNPSHYYLRIAGTNGTLYSHTFMSDESLTNARLYSWNTLKVKDGTYTIRLEARDAAGGTSTSGNKDAGSVAQVTVKVNNVPETKADCRDDGWRDFTALDFGSQGDCIKYLMHHHGHFYGHHDDRNKTEDRDSDYHHSARTNNDWFGSFFRWLFSNARS